MNPELELILEEGVDIADRVEILKKKISEIIREEYVHLIGKTVKIPNKGWNYGIVSDIKISAGLHMGSYCREKGFSISIKIIVEELSLKNSKETTISGIYGSDMDSINSIRELTVEEKKVIELNKKINLK